MSANQILITRENSNSDFVIDVITPTAGKAIGFDSNGLPAVIDIIKTPTVNTSLTSLTIDCSLADIFIISVSANSTFSLSNLSDVKTREVIVKNTSASSITVSLPNGHVYDTATVSLAAGKARRFTVEYINTKYYWDYSKELVNA